MNSRARRSSRRALLNVAALFVIVCSVFPVYWMLNTSLLPASVIKSSTPHLWPDQATLRNYRSAISDEAFIAALRN